MSLSLLVFTSNGPLLDPMRPMRGLEFSTGDHGYEALSVFVPMSLEESFFLFDRPGLPEVLCKADGITVWQGRLEDVELDSLAGGVTLQALGYWRGYVDGPHTKTYLAGTAQAIVNDLVATVNALNSFMSASTGLIQNPGVTLKTEIYEDKLPGEILDRLKNLGDNQTPPRYWEAGVYDDKVLHFRPRGDVARTWYVDVSALQLQRTLETLYNSAYGVYSDPANQRAVTSTASDQPSIDRYGLTRRAAVSVRTTETAVAEKTRDTFIEDRRNPPARAAITFDRLYDAYGTQWPNWSPHNADTIVMRNLPPTASVDIDRIRSFRIGQTQYHAGSDTISVTPEARLPSLIGRPLVLDIPGSIELPPLPQS